MAEQNENSRPQFEPYPHGPSPDQGTTRQGATELDVHDNDGVRRLDPWAQRAQNLIDGFRDRAESVNDTQAIVAAEAHTVFVESGEGRGIEGVRESEHAAMNAALAAMTLAEAAVPMPTKPQRFRNIFRNRR